MRYYILFLSAVVIIFSSICQAVSPPAPAIPYRPEETIQILTEAVHGIDPDEIMRIRWRVVPENRNDAWFGLTFYREDSPQLICQLLFPDSNHDIIINGASVGQNKFQTSDLLIVPGFPVPCDVIPVADILKSSDSKIYEMKRDISDRKFTDRLQIECNLIHIDEAKRNGWIKEGESVQSDVRRIKVINLRTHELMLQQVWPLNGSWWLYEETQYRRSWRVR